MDFAQLNYNYCKKLFENSTKFRSLVSLSVTVDGENNIRIVKAFGIENKDAIELFKECIKHLENQEKNKIITLAE
jgi:hypothetical protein